MTQIDFTVSLIRLSRHAVGMAEASLLFFVAHGATAEQAAKAFRCDVEIIRGRMRAIRKKGFAEAVYSKTGAITYHPTAAGKSIIADALKL